MKNTIKIYDTTIKTLKKDKDNEFSLLNNEKDNIIKKIMDDKNNIEKHYIDIYSKKENDYKDIINKFENDKINIREQYFKDLQNIETKFKIQYDDKIKTLEGNIDKLQTEKTLEITSLIEKGKEITKHEYEKYIILQENYNKELKNNCETQIKDYNENNNKLNIFINELQTKNNDLTNKLFDLNKINENNKYDSIIGNFNVLNDKLNDNFNKFFKGNNEKGDYGELFIEKFLSDVFTNCKIIDTSNETAKGDLFFMFDKVKTLIESKNVQILKKEDIQKFYRDVEFRVAKNEINSAILISLNDTNLINGKRLFHFEIKYNIPIIMISNVFKNIEHIRFSILIFNYLIKNGFVNNETDEEKFTFVINSINEIYSYFKLQITHLDNDKQLIIKLEDSFKKRENDIYNIDKLFKNIFSKFPDLNFYDNKKNNNDLELILNKINNHIKILDSNTVFKINIKNLDSIGISKNDIRNIGGIKVLTDYFSDN